LGQGANQSIQDAFCLASLIYKYNHRQGLDVRDSFYLTKDPIPRFPLLNRLLNMILLVGKKIFDYLQVRVKNPNRLQLLAYEYERTQKFHVAMVTIGSRIMGFIETMGGRVGFQMVRIGNLPSLLSMNKT
jgi:hypothetical protein